MFKIIIYIIILFKKIIQNKRRVKHLSILLDAVLICIDKHSFILVFAFSTPAESFFKNN
jgi:hypothetical protein